MINNELPTVGSNATPLEEKVLKDYGKYVFKGVDVPAFTAPTRSSGFGMGFMGGNPFNRSISAQGIAKAKEAYDKDLANLGSALPKGVMLVGNQLRITPEASSLYNLDPKTTNLYTSIRNEAAKEAQLKAYNATLTSQGKEPVSAVPVGINGIGRLGGVPSIYSFGGVLPAMRFTGGMADFAGNMNRNSLRTYNGPLSILGGNVISNRNRFGMGPQFGMAGMAGIGGGLGRFNKNQNVTGAPVTTGEQVRTLDEALAEYLRLNPGMSLDQLKAQQDTKRNAMSDIQQNSVLAKPQSPDVFNQYTQPQQTFARGGEVKGYEEGGIYDPENPDFAGQVQANMAQNPLYAQREMVPTMQESMPVARPSAVDEALAQRRAIMGDLNKAMTARPASSGMTEAEKYFRLAAAFGKTGKTGHFGESLSSVGDAMADIEAEKRKEAREQAAAGLQRLQARSELANQQYTLAREGEMQDLLRKYVTKGQDVTGDVTSRAAADGIPEDVKGLILALPTDKAVTTIIDMAKEANKPSDLIRGVNFLVKNGSITPEQGASIVKENLQGKLEQVDVTVPQLGGTVKLTGPEARTYYDTGDLPTRFGMKPAAAPQASQLAAPQATQQVASPVMTQEQIKAKETGLVEQAKKDVEASDTLLSQRSFAKQQKDAANEVLGLVKKSPKAFGIIADPNWSNAVANLLESGVNTPFGSFGLALEEPIAKIKLTGPEAATRQLAVRPMTLIEVGYRKLFLKGEGAVSNMEGALTKYIGPQLSDTPKVVQLKAGMIAIGAEKQEKIVDAFERYKESRPDAGPRSFYQTPEYKRIVDTYETKYRAFAKKNDLPVDANENNATPTQGSGSLVDRLKAERANRK